uniref:Uncharacterized protein n=1 Tax=Nymphaea colorata TaxID=210225 RepID=A0A5K1AUI7_9MAGN
MSTYLMETYWAVYGVSRPTLGIFLKKKKPIVN